MVFECSFVSNNSATADIKERLPVRIHLLINITALSIPKLPI